MTHATLARPAPLRTLAAVVRVAALLATPTAAIVLLHGLGDAGWATIDATDPLGWLAAARPEDALAALLRIASLVVAYWLFAGTVVTLLARMHGAWWRPARLLAPAALRRLVDRAVVATAAAGVAVTLAPGVGEVASAHATPHGPVVAPAPPGLAPPVADAQPDGSVPSHVTPDPRPPRLPTAVETLTAADDVATSTTDGSVHVVVTGDHLWSIARDRLAAHHGIESAALAADEIAPYWHRVVEINRGTIASGDPDLIQPGERIVLPPVGDG